MATSSDASRNDAAARLAHSHWSGANVRLAQKQTEKDFFFCLGKLRKTCFKNKKKTKTEKDLCVLRERDREQQLGWIRAMKGTGNHHQQQSKRNACSKTTKHRSLVQ
jgi:hypothetical protein